MKQKRVVQFSLSTLSNPFPSITAAVLHSELFALSTHSPDGAVGAEKGSVTGSLGQRSAEK